MSQNNSSGPLQINYFNELTSDSFNSIKEQKKIRDK